MNRESQEIVFTAQTFSLLSPVLTCPPNLPFPYLLLLSCSYAMEKTSIFERSDLLILEDLFLSFLLYFQLQVVTTMLPIAVITLIQLATLKSFRAPPLLCHLQLASRCKGGHIKNTQKSNIYSLILLFYFNNFHYPALDLLQVLNDLFHNGI